ncbi:hypothetical protein INP44_13645, partial [Staphylococcus aureus]|nr:hypothetical protein [Staphylococcus aureus]
IIFYLLSALLLVCFAALLRINKTEQVDQEPELPTGIGEHAERLAEATS